MPSDERWLRTFAWTKYRFVRVSRATGNELETLPMLKGGSIERNNDVRIMERASIGRVGELSIGADLVRCYLSVGWRDGTSEDVALGTFIPSIPSRDVRSGYSTATVSMRGRLQELMDDGFATPVVLPAGTNAVAAAREVCEGMGLEVVSDPSDYETTRARTYGIGAEQNNSESGETKLDMVNDLLGLAGFWAAKTDPYGRVLFRRYRELSERAPSWAFEEGPSARFEGSMTHERDETGVANHVVCVYSGEGGKVVGEAWDRDPSSPYSTVSLGRTVTRSYTYSDLPEGDGAQMQATADSQAAKYLAQNQSVIERVKMRHTYVPVAINDAVELCYPSGGISGRFEVRTQTLTLTGGCPVEAELRRFLR